MNGGKAWCLSKDRRDGEGFRGVVGGKTCYETLRFNGANSGVCGWHYRPRPTHGRRSLENALSPTEAAEACEADHPEGFVELSSDVPEGDSFDAHATHMMAKITTLKNEVNHVLDDLSAQIVYMQEKFEMSSKQEPSDVDEDTAEEGNESLSEPADERRHLS